MSENKRNKLPRSVRSLDHGKAKKTWILIAQRTKAKLIEHLGMGKQLTLIRGFINPAGELHTSELVSDRPGRSYRSTSVGIGRSSLGQSEDAHEHALTLFAKDLASTIEEGVVKGNCDQIILAAEPHCLGKIKKTLSPQARKRVSATIDQDLFLLNNQKLYLKLEDELR